MKTIDPSAGGINTDRFVQVPHALLDSGIEPGALFTYMAIRREAWAVGDQHRQGIEALAAGARVSTRTVTRHLIALEDVCAVRVERRGSRNPIVITVLPHEGIVPLPDPLCTKTSVSDHVHHDDRTPVSLHTEVIGHEAHGAETPVSPTTGHGCLIRIEEDSLQTPEESLLVHIRVLSSQRGATASRWSWTKCLAALRTGLRLRLAPRPDAGVVSTNSRLWWSGSRRWSGGGVGGSPSGVTCSPAHPRGQARTSDAAGQAASAPTCPVATGQDAERHATSTDTSAHR